MELQEEGTIKLVNDFAKAIDSGFSNMANLLYSTS